MPLGSTLSVYEAEDYSKLGFSLEKDSLLHNFTDEESQLMKDGKVPWRGAREKSMEFLSIVIQTLTRKHDIVMDLQCGTCFSLPSYTLSLSFISCFCIFNFFSLPHSISFHLGASITACRMAERHIVALERDSEIFEAVLLPMRDSVPPAEPVVAHPDPSSTEPRQKLLRRHRKCA